MKKYNVREFETWGRWDVDGEGAKALAEAIESGLPFDISFHPFAKTDGTLAISRHEDLSFTVKVHLEMDDLMDGSLIYDSVLEVADEELLTDDVVDEIREKVLKTDFMNTCTLEDELEWDSQVSDVSDAYFLMLADCQDILDEEFAKVQKITEAVLDGDKAERATRLAEEAEAEAKWIAENYPRLANTEEACVW